MIIFLSISILFTGKYLLVRDPNKAQLRLYSVPAEEAEILEEEDEGGNDAEMENDHDEE